MISQKFKYILKSLEYVSVRVYYSIYDEKTW